MKAAGMTSVSIAIILISAATIALELVLTRALSIAHWHHLAFLVISTALLGFGAAGTVITIARNRLVGRHKELLWFAAFGFAVAGPAVFCAIRYVGLDELQLIWDSRQVLYLFAYYLLLAIPFFFAGGFISLTFAVWGQDAARLYFVNMTGSGLGAAAALALMFGRSTETIILFISAAAFLAAVVLSLPSLSRAAATVFSAAILLVLFSRPGPLSLQVGISEHKALVYYSALPHARILATGYSPLGRLDMVEAPAIRLFPGLSINYTGPLPKQALIITDADGTSPLNKFATVDELRCYRHSTSAVAYSLVSEPDVCIIGSGGGSDVAQALVCGAKNITAVEMNPQVIRFVSDFTAAVQSNPYCRGGVRTVIAEGRNFLRATGRSFDIINISLLDSFAASAAGLYALNESHLYTIEAITQALSRLKSTGVLCITRTLKSPPRDSIKMFATVVRALTRRGVDAPAEHIVMIRSFSTATILTSPTPLGPSQIESARRFAHHNGFDLVHLPGIRADETNIYHTLETAVYYKCARLILDDAETFYDDYLYNVRPATDDRPYFFDFFKWRALPHMLKTARRQWLLFSEWGYLVLAATLLQAVIAGAVFIMLPLFVAEPIRQIRSRKAPVFLYFFLLGAAYMFLEMGFIQKLTLLIGHPVYGVAVTLTGFLFFSGLGSLLSPRFFRSPSLRITVAVSVIILVGLAEIALAGFAFDRLVAFSRAGRIAIGLVIIAPLAFFMGIPFPTAIARLHVHSRPLVPWAWAINGFASVIAAVLGTLLAISIGFTALVVVALICYFLAAAVAKPIVTAADEM